MNIGMQQRSRGMQQRSRGMQQRSIAKTDDIIFNIIKAFEMKLIFKCDLEILFKSIFNI